MKLEIKGTKAAGSKTTGEILFLGRQIRVSDLDKRITGKIIGGGKFGKTILVKAQALDVGGVVLAEISDEVFEEVALGKNWEIGGEPVVLSLPLLVIKETDLSFLEENQGEKAILDPEEKRLTLCP
ncbi:hypothetical protein HZB97_02560 [Candidatus Gottesmanbacteria bacterium]|nr:hypothetical protein [Candidatus Gottesmanbacteria bacterium]MBI5465175.1 hypothetical protein [Candidatus Gottesmanbacteria bacterium]